ncbi:glyoxalase [Azorhizobium oxalatiphilum]|uniref:Glyoxalase n=1 Tax=Azorhizobium oxalatiphilum TaxID=980631 RepID=A0A917CG90_9HYPH|nr:VOC family protein [Azorhizobium oxalatiphilum]GGF87839.1 glyoxalase [Azorhizobium oxalatiphilum]
MTVHTPPAFGLHLVTLGVADLPRATTFYEAMGLSRRDRGSEGVSFFDAGGMALALFPRSALTADAGLPAEAALPPYGAPEVCGLSLAFNVGTEAAVEEVITLAQSLGAPLLKTPERAFWGGYTGYFADLDGHIWEVAHNPFWPLDDRGRPVLPD